MSKLIKIVGSAVLFAAITSGASTSVRAADMPLKAAAPVVEAWNPWMIRLRALTVVPRDSGNVDQIPGSDLAVSTTVVPELDITYFLTPNIAAEVILGVTRHHVTGRGTINGVDVGSAWLLPPTVTLQYHFTQFGAFKPYVGAGPNYTVFFGQDAAGGVVTAIHLNNTFGVALQGGFDYMLNRNWGINVDVKKLFLRPSFTATVAGLPMTGKANLDPWLIGVGLTYKF
jgi:outer membrane protein